MKKIFYFLLALPLLFCFSELISTSGGVAALFSQDRTGGPVSVGTCGSCHGGGSFSPTINLTVLNAGMNPVSQYTPGATYTLRVQVSSTGAPSGFGFQAIPLRGANIQAGTMVGPSALSRLSPLSGRVYFEHSALNPSGISTVQWTAPAQGSGTVSFYFIGLAANGNSGTSGDNATSGQTFSLTEACLATSFAQSITICLGGSYSIGVHTYSQAGSYSDTLLNAGGCDSIVVTNLNVNPILQSSQNINICSGDAYSIGIHSYTSPGSYIDTLTTGLGCDSAVTTNLFVHPNVQTSQTQTICAGGAYLIGANTYTQPGVFIDTLLTSFTCDSIVTTTLIVNPVFHQAQNISICQGGFYSIGTHTYTQGGSYTDTLLTVNNCDSVIATTLTVNPTHQTSQNVSICSGAAYSIGIHTYTQGGTYADTLLSNQNCDSVVTTVLTVIPAQQFSQQVSICQGQFYAIGTNIYSTPGTFIDTLQAANSCDSIVTTMLSVTSQIQFNQSISICQGDSLLVGIHFYDTAGTYTDTVNLVGGCDSVINTILMVNQSSITQLNDTICQGESVVVGSSVYSQTGNYRDTLSNSVLCDSIIQLTLVVNPTPTVSISVPDTLICDFVTSVVLSGTPPGGTFSGPGVTGNTFNPSQVGAGLYWLRYHFTNTDSCSNEDSVRVRVDVCFSRGEDVFSEIKINPCRGEGAWEVSGLDQGMKMRLIDLNGKLISEKVATSGHHTFYGQGTPALYWLWIEDGTKRSVFKLPLCGN